MTPCRDDLYFAYGSNLDPEQMITRCPNARFVTRAELHGFRLVFGGFSRRWGGAVASVEPQLGQRVSGCVYALGPGEFELLDRFEGNYFRAQQEVRSLDATPIDGHPYHYRLKARPNSSRLERSEAYAEKLEAAYRRLRFDLEPLYAALRRMESRR